MNLLNLLSNFPNFNFEFPKDGDENYEKIVKTSNTSTHSISVEKWISKDGSSSFERITSKLIPNKEKTLKELKQELEDSIKCENFEQSCKIRDEIKKIENK